MTLTRRSLFAAVLWLPFVRKLRAAPGRSEVVAVSVPLYLPTQFKETCEALRQLAAADNYFYQSEDGRKIFEVRDRHGNICARRMARLVLEAKADQVRAAARSDEAQSVVKLSRQPLGALVLLDTLKRAGNRFDAAGVLPVYSEGVFQGHIAYLLTPSSMTKVEATP